VFDSMVPPSFVTIVFGGEVREGGCAWPLCTLCDHRVTVDVGEVDCLSLQSQRPLVLGLSRKRAAWHGAGQAVT
jgi:hypothetical protein